MIRSARLSAPILVAALILAAGAASAMNDPPKPKTSAGASSSSSSGGGAGVAVATHRGEGAAGRRLQRGVGRSNLGLLLAEGETLSEVNYDGLGKALLGTTPLQGAALTAAETAAASAFTNLADGVLFAQNNRLPDKGRHFRDLGVYLPMDSVAQSGAVWFAELTVPGYTPPDGSLAGRPSATDAEKSAAIEKFLDFLSDNEGARREIAGAQQKREDEETLRTAAEAKPDDDAPGSGDGKKKERDRFWRKK